MTEKLVRYQVYASRKLANAVEREAKAARVSRSQAVQRLMERGARRSPTATAEPAEQLALVIRMLGDHRRAVAQDLMLNTEMTARLLREFFIRFPSAPDDLDALRQAAGDARVEEVIDEAVERIIRGERRRTASAAEPVPAERVLEAAE